MITTDDMIIKAATVYGIGGLLDSPRLTYGVYKAEYLDPILQMWEKMPAKLRRNYAAPAMTYLCWCWAVSHGQITVDGGVVNADNY